MLPRVYNSGSIVRSIFTKRERMNALEGFYRKFANGQYYQNYADELAETIRLGIK